MKRNLPSLLTAVLLFAVLCSGLVCPAFAQTPLLSPTTSSTPSTLIPGGFPFGVKFTTEGVLVVGFCDITTQDGQKNPARDAGLKIKDVITAIGGTSVESAGALTDAISSCNGSTLTITYQRGGEEHTATLTPVKDENGIYRTGLYVRDSGAGIGTVTYIDPKTLAFGGLGHGICDIDTGELMPLRRGNVVEVTISGINRGMPGTPGELGGYFNAGKLGTLLQNCPCGVFGVYAQLPEGCADPLPVATRDEIQPGTAQIYCTLSSNERRAYDVTLSAIDRSADGSKCFSIQVTDPALLEETGGIVQGMSGSPVIQNGKLIGAVTHVLISDPSRGYGIFIENMLNSAAKTSFEQHHSQIAA